jgi:hypothetical protein
MLAFSILSSAFIYFRMVRISPHPIRGMIHKMTDRPPKSLLRRSLWIALALSLVAAPFIVTAVRTHTAERLLREQLAIYRSRGEPVTLADLQPPPVADGDNGALVLRAAIASLDVHPDATNGYEETPLRLPWTNGEQIQAREELSAYRLALHYLRSATTKPAIDWKILLRSPLFQMKYRELESLRALANHAALAMLDAHVRGDDAEALRYGNDLIYLSRATDQMAGGLVAHLVADGIMALACDKICQITSELQVLPQSKGGHPVMREQVNALIAELTNDQPQRDGQRRAFWQERVLFVDSMESILNGSLDPAMAQYPVGLFFIRHYFLTDARVGIENVTDILAAAESHDWPPVQQREAGILREIENHPGTLRFTRLLIPSVSKPTLIDFRGRTERHVAVLRLALRLYAIDHKGHLPETLDSLVPSYLQAIPTDPMAAGAPPLHYIFDPVDPRIYSVGNNGVDDGGSEALQNPKHVANESPSPWEKLDAVFHYGRTLE